MEPKAGRFWDLDRVARLVITVFTTSSVSSQRRHRSNESRKEGNIHVKCSMIIGSSPSPKFDFATGIPYPIRQLPSPNDNSAEPTASPTSGIRSIYWTLLKRELLELTLRSKSRINKHTVNVKSARPVLVSPPLLIAATLTSAKNSGKLLKQTDLSDCNPSFSSLVSRRASVPQC